MILNTGETEKYGWQSWTLLSIQPIPSEINIGQSVDIKLEKKNIPYNSWLVISLKKVNPDEGTLWIIGPIMLKPLSISWNWNQEISWDGNSIWCAPSDFPKWCKGIQPWEYYFEISLYDTADFFFLGWPRKREEKNEKLIQTIKSNTFHIIWEYSTKNFSSHFLTSVMSKVSQKYTISTSGMVQFNRYFQVSDIVKEWDVYCTYISGLSPFSWVIKWCTNEIHKISPSIEFIWDISYKKGIIPYQEATQKAHIIADAPYLRKVAFDHQPTWQELEPLWYDLSNSDEWYSKNPLWDTYLSTWIQEWVYRVDGAYWLFVIEEIMAWWREWPGRFADKVLVKVTDSWEACRVKTVSYNAWSFWLNLFTDSVSCE